MTPQTDTGRPRVGISPAAISEKSRMSSTIARSTRLAELMRST
jgi:hypothetical protein